MQILIAEGQAICRQGLRLLIEQQLDMSVTGEAEDGETALRLAMQLRPDLIIIDLALPSFNGIAAIRDIRAKLPTTKIVVLSAHMEGHIVKEAFSAGANAYVPKSADFEELLTAIRITAAGERYLSPRLTNLVLRDWLTSATGPGRDTIEQFTARQREILQFTAEGRTVKEIARRLHISIKTAHANRRQLMDKLDMSTVAEMTKYAIREGITPP